jgi:cathepsin A (carboxypeptidase C)
VQNDKFPEHTLKVKDPSKLGVDTVQQYSGYLEVADEDKHFFFWAFESRNDPKNDPVVLWLNGGPGCSSLTGLFFELGPASIDANLEPKRNDFSWNSNATVIFLDQPVNTGFSYSSGSVSDTVSAGKDAYAFLSLFFQQFPEYKDLAFHIAGESYAGHYVPVFADTILKHEDRGFNLTSVLIGNGLTDPLRQYDYYQPMACGEGGAPSVLEPQECESMLNAQSRCDSLIKACYDSQSAWTCVPATVYCNNVMMGPYQRTGRNVYDIREDCEGGNLCYPQLDVIDKYLNLPEVKAAVGAEIETYQGCNFDVNRNFVFSGDWMKPYYTSVSNLLEQDVPVLVYAGDKDFICNWLGNEAWSLELEWSGGSEFAGTELEPWTVGGHEAGQVRNYDIFTFLRVYGAGHMVPFNQPENSLAMLNSWLDGDFSFSA